jgi:hypothetical protein
MPDVRFKQGVLLVAILVASGDAFGRSEPRLGQTGAQVATPPLAMFVRTADSQTAPDPVGSEDGDEVPNKQHPAASTEGDEVPKPTALAPANPEPSSAAPQSVTSSSGDEVPAPVVVPDVVGVLSSKSTGAAGDETPAPAAPATAPSAVITDANTPIAPLLRDALQGDTARIAFEPFYQPVIMSRCGSPTAKSMSVHWQRWPISLGSMLTVSIQPTIRCRISRL